MNKKILCLFAIIAIAASTNHLHAQLTAGLKAYYPFSGNANDQSGNGHNCTMMGNPTLTPDRKSFANCAYSFPGDTNNYMKITFAPDFDIAPTGSFSISLWFNGYTVSQGDFESLFDKRNVTGTKKSDYHLCLTDNNKPGFGGPTSPIVFGSSHIPDNQWHHLVGTYSNASWKMYIDSVQKSSSSTTAITQSSADIFIGKNFNGKIDDVRFYNRVLSPAEVQQLFLANSSCAPNSVKEVKSSALKIFPMPVNKELNIVVPQGFSEQVKVIVTDMSGKEMFSQQASVSGEQITLLVQQLQAGAYIVTVTDKKGSMARDKFIKQ